MNCLTWYTSIHSYYCIHEYTTLSNDNYSGFKYGITHTYTQQYKIVSLSLYFDISSKDTIRIITPNHFIKPSLFFGNRLKEGAELIMPVGGESLREVNFE